jgi:hypothetical protein
MAFDIVIKCERNNAERGERMFGLGNPDYEKMVNKFNVDELLKLLHGNDKNRRLKSAEALLQIIIVHNAKGEIPFKIVQGFHGIDDKNIYDYLLNILKKLTKYNNLRSSSAHPISLDEYKKLIASNEFESYRAGFVDKDILLLIYFILLDCKDLNERNNTECLIDAINGLGAIGDARAVIPLIKLLDGFDTVLSESIESALCKLGNIAISPLIEVLSQKTIKKQSTKIKIITILGKTGDLCIIDPMLSVVKSFCCNESDFMQGENPYSAIDALANLGNSAVEPLIDVLNNSNSLSIRFVAIGALGKIKDKRAIIPLVEALNDCYVGIRKRAAEALGLIGDDQAIKPLLKELITRCISESNNTKFECSYYIRALEMFGKKAKEDIHDALKENNNRIVLKYLSELIKKNNLENSEEIFQRFHHPNNIFIDKWNIFEELCESGPDAIPFLQIIVKEETDYRFCGKAYYTLINLDVLPDDAQKLEVYYVMYQYFACQSEDEEEFEEAIKTLKKRGDICEEAIISIFKKGDINSKEAMLKVGDILVANSSELYQNKLRNWIDLVSEELKEQREQIARDSLNDPR